MASSNSSESYALYEWGARQAYDGRTMPDGKTYRFLVGDGIIHYGGFKHFSGMSIELPKRFPQIYLDSHKGGGRKAAYIIDASQKISLEGDFDSYFQLYAAKGAQTLALSIITPDVMRTLMDVAGEYDVELNYDRLNIISARPVFMSKSRQLVMQRIMEVVMLELGQKLPSWPADCDAPKSDRLLLSHLGGVRIFGRVISLWLLLFDALWGVVTFFFLATAVAGFVSDQLAYGITGFICFVILLATAVHINTYLLGRGRFRPDSWWYKRTPRG